LAVLEEVSFDFMPLIRAQKLFFLPASSVVFGFGAGGFKFIPCDFADARPFAFRPPLSALPSFLCHAGDLAILFGPRNTKRVWLLGNIA
jgi:hypothetical protein